MALPHIIPSTELILALIHSKLKDVSIHALAEARIEELVSKGIDIVKLEHNIALAIEAKNNFVLLAEQILVNVNLRLTTRVEIEDIEKALDSLCPIYPIC